MDRVPTDVLQVVEVKNQDSITAPFVVVASECYIDIFTLEFGQEVLNVVHHKKSRIKVDTICSNLEEASTFYIIQRN